jgi:phasin family protein
MLTFAQPTTPAVKAYMDAQLSLLNDMSRKLFTTAQKINELNLQVVETVMEESLTNAQKVLEAKDPYEALAIGIGQAQPTAEKMRAYQQHLAYIAAETQAELASTADAHVPETNRAAAALADELDQKASGKAERPAPRKTAAVEKLAHPAGRKRANGGARNGRRST